jgi:hypothetical protein
MVPVAVGSLLSGGVDSVVDLTFCATASASLRRVDERDTASPLTVIARPELAFVSGNDGTATGSEPSMVTSTESGLAGLSDPGMVRRPPSRTA